MAAVVQSDSFAPNPGSWPERRDALEFLKRHVSAQRPCAVITGDDPEFISEVLTTLTTQGKTEGRDHWVSIPAPTDSPQAFVEAILAQLGYELCDAGVEAIQSLLTVFLRHESSNGRRLIVVLDQAEVYGPRVLDFLDQLLRVKNGGRPAVTLVLGGSSALNRVLDSPGMARLAIVTRERFEVSGRGLWQARQPAVVPPPAPTKAAVLPPTVHSLEIMLDGQVLQRLPLKGGRLMIGRSRHSDLRLGGSFVSRHHALVLVSGSAAFIVDLRSTNGTRVNEQPVRHHALRTGDLVGIGNFVLRYEAGPDSSLDADTPAPEIL